MERLLIDDFNTRKNLVDSDSDFSVSLPKSCKKLAELYFRVEITGKLSRTVPLLIRCDLVKCIDLILKYRSDANVPSNNKYVFALPGIDKNRVKFL